MGSGDGGGGEAVTTAASKRCAACKAMRRRCREDCAFSAYFPASHPRRFHCVHRIFGAANVSRMLKHLPMEQRGEAVDSLVYEANARILDPVYGCVRVIAELQHQLLAAQEQLAIVRAEIAWCRSRELFQIEKHSHQGEVATEDKARPTEMENLQFDFPFTELDLALDM
ncbi:LOB domain-containing protein 12 [Nymphaea thermarum]|nr:LOB domain-containing protein 12 [Nymphaea thermarum]